MFTINWAKEWEALAVEVQGDRRTGADGRARREQCIYLTVGRLMGRMPMAFIEQDTIGL